MAQFHHRTTHHPEVALGGVPKQPLEESVNANMGGETVNVGDEVMTFINSHCAEMQLGVYRGLTRIGDQTRYTEKYVIERSNGKRSLMHFKNFTRLDTSLVMLADRRF